MVNSMLTTNKVYDWRVCYIIHATGQHGHSEIPMTMEEAVKTASEMNEVNGLEAVYWPEKFEDKHEQ
jgi:hypothetical protein